MRLYDQNGLLLRTTRPNANGYYVLPVVPGSNPLRLAADAEAAHIETTFHPQAVQTVDLTLPNSAPRILRVFATLNGQEVTRAPQGATVQLTVTAVDSEGDPLHYRWLPSLSQGGFVSVDSATVSWQMPTARGYFYVRVSDGRAGYATARVGLTRAATCFSADMWPAVTCRT